MHLYMKILSVHTAQTRRPEAGAETQVQQRGLVGGGASLYTEEHQQGAPSSQVPSHSLRGGSQYHTNSSYTL
jgi:hypothetical protein